MNTPARSVRPLVITVVVLVVAFAAVWFWRAARHGGGDQGGGYPTEVVAETLKGETLPQSLEAIGSVEAVRQVTLAPEVAGRVVAIRFEAGAKVERGAMLVQLYDAPEQADRQAAAATAEFARLQQERSKELAPTGAESKEVLQQRAATFDQAQAAVKQLDARIAQKAIRAPFDGRLGIRRIHLGQVVNAGDPVATLVSLDPLFVNFTVPQQELVKLKVGGAVEVRTDAYPDRTFTATISAIDPVVAADTRNVAVQATLPNADELLRPGLYVTAGVALPTRENAIVVPLTAINSSASGDSAYLVREGKVAVVPVVTGARIGTRIVVEQGLAPGDVLITRGQVRVQPGSAVTVAQQ
ncbi:MAG: efflux RND transporter periplasmic adaptor subunit [Steroidobacteraceae bacterium]